VARQHFPFGWVLRAGPPASLAEAIHRADGGQALEQAPPVLDLLATSNLQGGEERLLKTLVGVGSVAENPVGRLPHRLPVPIKDLLPVRHAFLRWLFCFPLT
jgi:hypothetical protein